MANGKHFRSGDKPTNTRGNQPSTEGRQPKHLHHGSQAVTPDAEQPAAEAEQVRIDADHPRPEV